MQQLFGNIQDIIRFQQLFLDNLEQSLCNSDDVKVNSLTDRVDVPTCQLTFSNFCDFFFLCVKCVSQAINI